MHISDDPRVFKVDQSVIDKKATSRRRVEDIEVSVFDPNAVEVGRGKCSGMEGGRVLAIALASYSYKVSIFSNAPIRDVSSRLCLSFLIEEDNGVEVRLSPIVSYPSLSRVFGILKIASEGRGKSDRLRGGGRPSDSGVVLGEANGFIRVDTIFTHVWINEVEDARDEEKVLYRLEVAVGGFEGLVVKSIIA